MEMKREGRLLKRYRVALGFAPERHKEREGDGRTPEGRYSIDARNPKSAFHLSLRVSYPDDKDKARAAASGARTMRSRGVRRGRLFPAVLERMQSAL